MLFMQFIFIQRGGVGTQFRKGTNVSSEKGNSTSVNQTDNIIITPCLCQRCGAEFGIKIHKGCLLDYNYACPKCGQTVYVKFGKPTVPSVISSSFSVVALLHPDKNIIKPIQIAIIFGRYFLGYEGVCPPMWSKLKNIQIFYPTLLTHKKLHDIFIFGKNGNYLKANLLKSRDAKPEGAKVRKFDHVSRLLLFSYI